ncbi:MAG: FAD-dependent oxidoreductase [Candidatus Pacebacteria bacterium]|nr:FAD-dependent oxidoreductase [Candidatus Paceibacterota bacterium]
MAEKAESLWVATSPKTDFSELKGNIKIDVAIVGGGIFGLTVAFILKEAGLKVAVLESERIVKGTTGYTTAKITSAHGVIYKYLISHFGRKNAKIYADSNQRAIEKISEIIKEKNISCNFERKPAYTYASSKKEAEIIKEEFEASKSLGLPVSFVEKLNVPFGFLGAVCFENQAQFHPRKYLLALANLIDGEGSYIFENSTAKNIKDGSSCIVETEKNKIEAKNVIIATRTPIIEDKFYLKNLIPRQSYLIACRAKDLPFEGMFYSREVNSFSLRTHSSKEGNFILVGGGKHEAGKSIDIKEQYENLKNYARKTFQVESIDYYWSAEDNYTIDRVPFIGKFLPDSENIYVACGFGAWGMTKGTLSAILLSDTILGKRNSWVDFYSPKRLYKETTKKIMDKKEDEIFKIPLNEGKVIKTGFFKKIAVYKDESGKIYVISPKCTHMGCTVGWNNKEKTWDCPCHGSRYDKYGKVIRGPAKRNLEEKNL